MTDLVRYAAAACSVDHPNATTRADICARTDRMVDMTRMTVEGYSAFLPVALLAFAAVFFGAHTLFEWVEHPMAAKVGYLNLPFFIVRNVVILGALALMTIAYVRNSLKPDMAEAQQAIPGWGGSFAQRLLKGYGAHETEIVRLEQRARWMAPALATMYALGYSFVVFDYLMSLDQLWFSTLFGA